MRSTLSLICLLGLVISLVWAAPAPARVQKRSFKVERVRNPNFTRHSGPRQLMKAYRKYGIRPPQALVDRLQAEDAARKAAGGGEGTSVKNGAHRGHGSGNGSGSGNGNGNGNGSGNGSGATGSGNSGTSASSSSSTSGGNATSTDSTGTVTNTPTSGDVEYLAPVVIGGQTLTMDFDTGSSDLWVFNTLLSRAQQSGHTLFNVTQSSTFQQLEGQTFRVSYGDGSEVRGVVGTDTVNIGGATVTKQAVELATDVSQTFIQDQSSDGLVGLAFSDLNTVQPTQQKTFFDNIKNDLAEPVFTADLRHDASGAYEFGAIDTSKFTGSLNFVPVNTSQGFWQFSSTKFAIGNGDVQTSSATGQAIADTGTTLLLANENLVNAYYSGVNGAQNNNQVGGITIPCDANLPDLQLDVGGTMATVSGSDIMFEQVQGNTCFGGLQAIDSDLQIFGDIFFKSNFVVFNSGNNTIGVAAHA